MSTIKLVKRLLKARRAGLIRLRVASKPTRLECPGGECSLCCEILGGTHVEQDELPPLVDAGMIVEEDGIARLRCNGSCCAIVGNKKCTLYDYRPKGCREYPWYNFKGKLYYDTGCPGIRHDYDEHPDPETLRPVEAYFLTAKPIQKFLLWLIRHW